MNRQVIKTKDGSNTLYVPNLDECYHSRFGAFTESMHIFIQNGFYQIKSKKINILEIGFGTGLNSILTYIEGTKTGKVIFYETIEKYPLSVNEADSLNYNEIIGEENYKKLKEIHNCEWGKKIALSQVFSLTKIKTDLLNYRPTHKFDVIYFDAFAPNVQPELWTKEIFKTLYECLEENGLLVTYSTKGIVKQNLIDVGFTIEKFQGPPGGKKECLRAKRLY